jgi:Right handed beta helix region
MRHRKQALDWGIMAALLILGPLARADTITVNDGGDVLHNPGCAATARGTCTLRDAITFANATPDLDVIVVGGGLTIRPTSSLPAITDPVMLFGYSTDGFVSSPATIDGALAGPSDGLILAADSSRLVGFTIQNFERSGLVILGNNNDLGQRCYSSCIPDTKIYSRSNGAHGLEIRGGSGNVLRAGYLLANRGNGIYLHGGATANYISDSGALAEVKTENNDLAGIQIGADAHDAATHGNRILGMSGTLENGGLAIDLGGDCSTPNDPLDADLGPNGLQNFPVISDAFYNDDGTLTTISGIFAGAPNAHFSLRFFVSGGFFDLPSITTDGTGAASFSFTTPAGGPGPPNSRFGIAAIATDAESNTSEFSPFVAPQGLAFHTVDPCRLVDTRAGTPPAPLLNGRPNPFYGRGACGIPSTARALVLNVTVTNATASGHVSFGPGAPRCQPQTSTINFSAGQTRSNNAIVTLAVSGNILAFPSVEGSGSVDLILDVSGYLE